MISEQNKNNTLTLNRKTNDKEVTKKCEANDFLKQRPWLNINGSFKSDEEISLLGKNWSSATWNEYLDANIGKLNDDEMVFFPYMDSETILDGSNLLNMLNSVNEYPALKQALKLSLKKLTPKESNVIKMRYWDNKSYKEIATIMKVSPNTVKKFRQRAIEKLRKLLPSKEFRNQVKHLESKKN